MFTRDSTLPWGLCHFSASLLVGLRMPPSLFYSLHLTPCRALSSSLWSLGCRLPHSQRQLDFPLPSSQTVSERIGEIINIFEKKGFYLKEL
ncbi:hypothetical protein K1719_028300 [Acacia pycnantha]|nr:hypothetical protein K1719_028300 [Acacia pycnantha]